MVGGIPVQVLDTAGIREAMDQVEQMGIARSQAAAQSADLVLLAFDASVGWTEAEQQLYETVADRPHLLVMNKVDLAQHNGSLPTLTPMPTVVKTVAAQGQGIEDLEQAILATVNAGQLTAANTDLAINQRQAAALTQAKTALEQVQTTIENQLPLDFWTIDLRSAIQSLGQVTGEELTESMLDEIFSRFCIGQ